MRLEVQLWDCVEGCLYTVRLCCMLQIAFVDMPSFSFDLNMYGGDLTLLPGVEMWLNSIIKEYVLGCVYIIVTSFPRSAHAVSPLLCCICRLQRMKATHPSILHLSLSCFQLWTLPAADLVRL